MTRIADWWRVAGREALALVRAVIDAGVVAVPAVPAGPEDLAGGRGPDRRAAGGREVDSGVQLPHPVDRVEAHAEVAGLPAVARASAGSPPERNDRARRPGPAPESRRRCGHSPPAAPGSGPRSRPAPPRPTFSAARLLGHQRGHVPLGVGGRGLGGRCLAQRHIGRAMGLVGGSRLVGLGALTLRGVGRAAWNAVERLPLILRDQLQVSVPRHEVGRAGQLSSASTPARSRPMKALTAILLDLPARSSTRRNAWASCGIGPLQILAAAAAARAAVLDAALALVSIAPGRGQARLDQRQALAGLVERGRGGVDAARTRSPARLGCWASVAVDAGLARPAGRRRLVGLRRARGGPPRRLRSTRRSGYARAGTRGGGARLVTPATAIEEHPARGSPQYHWSPPSLGHPVLRFNENKSRDPRANRLRGLSRALDSLRPRM